MNQMQPAVKTVIIVVALFFFGCNHAEQNTPVPSSTTVNSQVKVDVKSPPDGETSKTPVRDALVSMLTEDAAADHLFPVGVKVNGIVLRDGTAYVDFNNAFSALANSGESVESAAQKMLRTTLAKFPSIDKVTVSVEGKRFDSQATDWTTPFAVKGVEDNRPKNAAKIESAGQ